MIGIVNPLDVPVPQKVSDDVSILIPRPAICHLGKKFDGTFGDVVTGTQLQTAIAGTRYGVINGVVTSFGPNIPAVEDKSWELSLNEEILFIYLN